MGICNTKRTIQAEKTEIDEITHEKLQYYLKPLLPEIEILVLSNSISCLNHFSDIMDETCNFSRSFTDETKPFFFCFFL